MNMMLVEYHTTGNINGQLLQESMTETSVAFNTCLFINDFLEKTKVAGNILQATKKFTAGGAFDDYSNEYWKAINLIMADAKKSAL